MVFAVATLDSLPVENLWSANCELINPVSLLIKTRCIIPVAFSVSAAVPAPQQ